MKAMFSSLSLGVAVLLACGCRSAPPDPNAPPRYGEKVQVISYDSTPRPFNPNIQVFSGYGAMQGRSRHPIADLMIVGWPNDQALIMNALIWRAKSLGADGVVLLPPRYAEFVSVPFGRVGRQFNFQAEAFVWPYHIALPAPSPRPVPAQGSGMLPPTNPAPASDGSTPPPPASVPAPK
jgi:hypothetical protein